MHSKDQLISIIIPVYNVLPWLDRCIRSVRAQDYANLEIILVDDGSTDGSGDRCDKWAGEDSRIHVIHQENGGLSEARNTGIRAAQGSRLVFVDSDDYVTPTYVSDLLELVNDDRADIGVTGFTSIKETEPLSRIPGAASSPALTCVSAPTSSPTSSEVSHYSVHILSPDEAICNMWYQKGIPNSAFGKIFPKEYFGEESGRILFPDGKLYEDLAVMYLLFSKAERIAWSDSPDYYYSVRQGSIMTSAYSSKKMDRVRVGEEILSWSRTQSPAVLAAGEERFFLCNVQTLRELPLTPDHKDEAEELWTNIKRYRSSVFHNRAVKPANRLIALASYLGLRPLKWLGKIYSSFRQP